MASCIFTNTPDEHFIIDRLEPGSPVIVASPCSGHGYKFASVIGEILADLAIERSAPDHNIDLFRLDRFGGWIQRTLQSLIGGRNRAEDAQQPTRVTNIEHLRHLRHLRRDKAM